MRQYKVELPVVHNEPICIDYDEEEWMAMLDRKKQRDAERRAVWAKIITMPGFNALQFIQNGKRPLTAILHPSIRPGVDWQLSSFDCTGKAIGHLDFNNNELESLCDHLIGYDWCGGTVEACYL